MRRFGARSLTVSAAQALANTRMLGGPLRLCGWSFTGTGASNPQTVDQSAAAPGAGATIASLSLGNGQYQVEWTLELTGTPGAADVDNVQLFIGSTLIATSVNLGAVGNYAQEEVNAAVSFGPLILAWKAIGAAAVGSVYKVEANVISLTQQTGTIFDGSQPVGYLSMAPQGTDKEWMDDEGVQIDTHISVQTTLGSIQGVLWYYLASDMDVPGTAEP